MVTYSLLSLGVLFASSNADPKSALPAHAERILESLDEWFDNTRSFELSYTVALRKESPETGATVEDRVVRARVARDGDRLRFISSDAVPKAEWGDCSPNDWDVSFDGTRTIRRECGVYIESDGAHEVFGHVLPTQVLHVNGLRAYLRQRAEGTSRADALSCDVREDGHLQVTFIWAKDKHGPGVYAFAEQWVVHRDHPYMVIEQRSYKRGGQQLNSEVIGIEYQKLDSGLFYPIRGRENMLTEDGRVWRSESFEADMQVSRIGIAPLPAELFQVEIPPGAHVLRLIEGMSFSTCGAGPSACADEAGKGSESTTAHQDRVSASLARTAALARAIPAPSVAGENAETLVKEHPASAHWQLGAWGGGGAAFAIASTLLFIRLARFSPSGRRRGA